MKESTETGSARVRNRVGEKEREKKRGREGEGEITANIFLL